MSASLYDKVEEWRAQLQQGDIDQQQFQERIVELWQQLQKSQDPAEKLLIDILDQTLALLEGAIYQEKYEQTIANLRSFWLEGC